MSPSPTILLKIKLPKNTIGRMIFNLNPKKESGMTKSSFDRGAKLAKTKRKAKGIQ